MKILFYFGGFAPLGGIETFCQNILKYFYDNSYNCTLLCWGKLSPMLQLIQQNKIKVIRSPLRWGCRWNLPDWLLLPFGLQQVTKANVVLFGKLFPFWLLYLLRLQAGRSTNFVFITPYKPILPDNNREKLRQQKVLNLFDFILVQSCSFTENLRTIGYLGKLQVIPYISPMPALIKPFPTNTSLQIGYLGRLVEDKNIALLFNAFSEFLAKNYCQKDLNNMNNLPTLHLFGDGHLRQELEHLARKLNIKSNVIFHGKVARENLEDTISSCHLFAFSSHVEGQCLAALEILASGRPIVATEAGAFPEILSDSRLGELVSAAEPKTFAEAISNLAHLVKQGDISPETIYSAYIERYSPNKIGERYLKILQSWEVN